jgi:hypothetical protein
MVPLAVNVQEQLAEGPYWALGPLPSPKVPVAAESVTAPEHGSTVVDGVPELNGAPVGCCWKLAGIEVIMMDEVVNEASNPLPCTDESLAKTICIASDAVSAAGITVPVREAS